MPAPIREAVKEHAPYYLNGSRRVDGNRMRQKVTTAVPRPITAMNSCARFMLSDPRTRHAREGSPIK